MSDTDPNQSSNFAYELPDVERPASTAPTEPQLEQEMHLKVEPEHDPYAALRFKDYRLFEGGWVLSVIGQQLQSVAVGWEMYQKTGKALTLGLIGLVQAFPVILLALPAGHVADRFNRRRVVMLTTFFSAVCSVELALASLSRSRMTESHWLLLMYGLLMLSATATALGGPARSALLPQTVPTEHFSNAVTWNSSFFQVAAVLGPAIGGLVIIKAAWPAFLLDAMCNLLFCLFLLFITSKPAAARREPATLKSLAAGVRFVFNVDIILATITLDLFAVLLGGATYLLPIFATNILHVGSVGFGWMRAAPAFGAFTMAMLVAHLPPMKKAGAAMLWAVAGFGAATIVFGLSRSFWLSLAMLYLCGAFDNISVVVRHTLVQVLTPDEMRGRVSAVNNVFIGASNELGGLESGVTAALFGAVASVVGGGIGTILVVIATALIWPQVRKFGSLHDARPIEPTEQPTGAFPVVLKEEAVKSVEG